MSHMWYIYAANVPQIIPRPGYQPKREARALVNHDTLYGRAGPCSTLQCTYPMCSGGGGCFAFRDLLVVTVSSTFEAARFRGAIDAVRYVYKGM
jgi:hypothetical protein